MKINLSGTGIIGIGIGILGVLYTAYENHKMREANVDTSKKLDMTMDEVTKKANIEVEQQIIDKAVERSVERQVQIAVADTARKVREDIRNDIDKAVRKEVEIQYKAISEEVADAVSERVSHINEDKLREQIAKRAEEKIVSKFDGEVKTMVSKYGQQVGSLIDLTNTFKSAITGNLGGNNGNPIRFTLG